MKNEFQKLVDHELSGLHWDERMRRNVLCSVQEEERPVKRKMHFALAMVLILVLAGSLALAAGLMFSPRYDAAKMADEALLKAYGITDEMLPFFRRTVQEEGEADIVKYTGLAFFEGVLGDYTVTVRQGKADPAWTLEDVEGAWGKEQLTEAIELCKTDGGFDKVLQAAAADAKRLGMTTTIATETVAPDAEEWAAVQQQRDHEERSARALAALTVDEMDGIARAAMQERFGLTGQQLEKLDYVEESCWWYMENEQAFYSLYYGLNQKEGEWTAGDGIYIVDVNVQTGVVEEVLYDTGLLGNG